MAHELVEESGYSLDELDVLQPTTRVESLRQVVLHPQPFVVQTHDITPVHAHSDMGYIFVAQTHPRGQVADGESSDIRWLTRDGVERLRDDEVFDNTRQLCLEIFDKFLTDWSPVAADTFSTDQPIQA